ncbi:MAG TPA: right-handed parallel beta-helix repeat-containing protein [Myxococcales bacterium]|jgi:hypothetical protein
MRTLPLVVLAGLTGLAGLACPAGTTTPPDASISLPVGVNCSATATVSGDAAALSSALAAAGAGTCVIVQAGTYTGNFQVPGEVSLVGEAGAEVTLQGAEASAPTVRLAPGAGLYRVKVVGPPGVKTTGVVIETGPATLREVTVSGAKLGVYAICEEDCGRVGILSKLDDVAIVGNSNGLWVNGAQVQVTGGRIAEQQPVSLSSGLGVVASNGAKLSMSGTTVEKNGFVGVFIDGTGGTEAGLTEVQVLDNADRGVWGQKIAGSAAAPKLRLDRCTVSGNRLAGIGMRESQGVSISGGRVASTVVVSVTGEDTLPHDVGDGLGLFSGTTEVLVDGVDLSGNGRSQVLIDQGGAGIVIKNGTIAPTGEQLGVVVQRTASPVQSPVTPFEPAAGQELTVSAPAMPLPSP